MDAVKLKNVSVSVETKEGKKQILDNISLELKPKKIYVVTGPNGGGKSTLAKTIMGIVKNDSGEIIYKGNDISNDSIESRSKNGIGYAFQTPAKFKGLKVRELLELSRGTAETQIDKMLRNVGLCPEDYLERKIDNSFSGGELKRIEIASVLVRDLDVALYDEPEAGIDLWSFKRITKTFMDLKKDTNTCIVIISHQERIMGLADEIIVIENGKIQKRTSKEEFLSTLDEETTKCGCDLNCLKGGKCFAE